MWRMVLLAAIFAAGVQAFAPAPLRWGGDSARSFVLAPSVSPSRIFVSPKVVMVPQKLTAWQHDSPSTMDLKEVPYFTPLLDKTIAWHGTDLCIEASGDKVGDIVSVNSCSGEPAQLWNLMPQGRGHKSQIQLKGTNKCIDVHGRDGGLNGAAVELQKCDDPSTGAWEFETLFPFPARSSAHPPPRYSMQNLGFPLAVVAVLGAMSMAGWLWLGLKQSRVRYSHGVITDDGGVSLTAPVATFWNDSPSILNPDERLVPAVMLIPTSEKMIDADRNAPGEGMEKGEAASGLKDKLENALMRRALEWFKTSAAVREKHREHVEGPTAQHLFKGSIFATMSDDAAKLSFIESPVGKFVEKFMAFEREEASEWKRQLIDEAAFGVAGDASGGAAVGDHGLAGVPSRLAGLEAAKVELAEAISSSPVVLFSFVDCPWCVAAKALLKKELAALLCDFDEVVKVIEVDEIGTTGKRLRAALCDTTGRTSMPSCFVNGRALGGYTDGEPVSVGLRGLATSGELRCLLEAAVQGRRA